jgi:hypothetical protein
VLANVAALYNPAGPIHPAPFAEGGRKTLAARGHGPAPRWWVSGSKELGSAAKEPQSVQSNRSTIWVGKEAISSYDG